MKPSLARSIASAVEWVGAQRRGRGAASVERALRRGCAPLYVHQSHPWRDGAAVGKPGPAVHGRAFGATRVTLGHSRSPSPLPLSQKERGVQVQVGRVMTRPTGLRKVGAEAPGDGRGFGAGCIRMKGRSLTPTPLPGGEGNINAENR